jgi:hypothetical protein
METITKKRRAGDMETITAVATPKTEMTSISFIAPYMPIICGIADYTGFITRECSPGTWNVLSFDLDNYGVPLSSWQARPGDPVQYCIPSRRDFSASSVLEALNPDRHQVLWFQHEFGIWSNSEGFVGMLRDLDYPKVVTLHTLHFQSNETVYGLRRQEYSFLRMLLPHTDAITVFSNGVYKAVTQAFTEYADKVHVLRHGTHLYPAVSTMSRVEAKERLHEYLVFESELNMASKDRLEQQRMLLDPETTLVGGAGFITASKGIDLLYYARDELQEMLPGRKIAALYIGQVREPDNTSDGKRTAQLRAKCNGSGQFFLETYMPVHMLALLLRALDVHFYWPSDCTQSGIVAHALGAGATIACRDMEGVGETVKLAGGLAHADLGKLLVDIKELIVDPRLSSQVSESALRYAEKFSWRNQALRHFELAEKLCPSRVHSLLSASSLAADTSARGEPSLVV